MSETRNGKKEGLWKEPFGSDLRLEYNYWDDSKNTHVFGPGYKPPLGKATGHYMNGEKQGMWTHRFTGGEVHEGPYVDGKANGQWKFTLADGQVEEGPYVDDVKHGQWTLRTADGTVKAENWVNGERQK